MKEALQSGLAKLLEEDSEPIHRYHRVLAAKAICETLGEVADDDTLAWALARLDQKPPAELAEPLAGLVSAGLGIPPVFRSMGLCGNSSAEEVARFKDLQMEELARTRGVLHASWDQVRGMTPVDRIGFATAAWRVHFVRAQESASGHFRHEDWLFEVMEPLVRFGHSAVASLRAAQQAETNRVGREEGRETPPGTAEVSLPVSRRNADGRSAGR